MRIAAISVVLATLAIEPARTQDNAHLLQVVVPELPPGSRLMGFSFDIASGRVASLGDAPAGWSVTIDNDPSWHAKITAHAVVGAAALETGELANLFLSQEMPLQDRISSEDTIKISGSIDVMKEGEIKTIREPSLRLRAIERPR